MLERSKVPLRKWVFAIYLDMTSTKGVSSMKLHRDIGVTQKTAWFMLHRIREAWKDEKQRMAMTGPIEVDETYLGGKLRNMHGDKRRAARRKPDLGKTIVAGARDRATGAVSGQVIEYADKRTLYSFVLAHRDPGATVYTDEAKAYQGLANHETICHGRGEYVRCGVSTNGMESAWALLKRAYHGIYHHWSPKHCDRYVAECFGRLNMRGLDTADQMAALVRQMVGKRLTYQALVA